MRWVMRLFRKREREAELDAELRFHIEQKTAELIAAGAEASEARRRAMVKLGGVEAIKQEWRESRATYFLESVLQDVRYGFRTLRKSPGFTTVAVLTLALGIGANTAIFSLIDAVMLRPLPAKDPSQLVLLRWTASARYVPNLHFYKLYGACSMIGFGPGPEGHVPSSVYSGCSFSQPVFREIEQANIFSGVGAFADLGMEYLSGIGPATTVDAEAVSGNFFDVVGVTAAAGRLLERADDTPSSAPVAVLSYGYWQSAFGGSRDAIGRVIDLEGLPLTIAGVAEPGFTGITPGSNRDLWLPLSDWQLAMGGNGRSQDPRAWWLTILGRLKPGERRAQAQPAVVGLLANQLLHGASPLFLDRALEQAPAGGSRVTAAYGGEPELTLVPAQTGLMGYRGLYASPLYVLLIAVGVVLLIACVNVAGLLVARAKTRQKEMALRLALGAGRGRVVRQLLTESVTLSLLGGALGVLIGYAGAHAIVSFIGNVQLMEVGSADPTQLRILGFAAIDPRILAFTLAVSLLTGILFGLAPAFRNARVDLTPALKEAPRGKARAGHAGGKWLTLGNGLVIAQVALAVLVLAGAGLLLRTLANLREVNLGFDTHHVLSFAVWAPPTLKGKQQATLKQELERRFAEMPGVQSASDTWWPLLMNVADSTSFHWPGTPAGEEAEADELSVGPHFFSTLRVPLIAGRVFNAADFELAATNAGAKPAPTPTPVIVNQKFGQQFAGRRNPLGIIFGEHGPAAHEPASPGYEIVGVVADAKLFGPQRKIYPLVCMPDEPGGQFFELRTAADPRSILPSLRKVLTEVNPNIALFQVTTESAQLDELLFRERLMARLSAFFSFLAMALACIGLYGLLSYETSQRTHEIGIRMAIGAQPGSVMLLVLRQGVLLALVGAALGTGAALGATRYLGSVLYGVHADDPTTLFGAGVALILVALAACYLPARRAMRVDPVVALRQE